MSAKLIVLRLLGNLPHYIKYSAELNEGLQLGKTLDSSRFVYPQKIFICKDNVGVGNYIEEFDEKFRKKVLVVDDANFISNRVTEVADGVLLLYINNHLFQDEFGRVNQLVRVFITHGIKVVLVNEMDSEKGHCDIKQIVSQTSKELLALGLFTDEAIPLYTRTEYRQISLYLVKKRMNDFVHASSTIN